MKASVGATRRGLSIHIAILGFRASRFQNMRRHMGIVVVCYVKAARWLKVLYRTRNNAERASGLQYVAGMGVPPLP